MNEWMNEWVYVRVWLTWLINSWDSHMTSDWVAEYCLFYRALLLFYRALLHMNSSHQTRTWMNETRHTYMNESHHTYEWLIHLCARASHDSYTCHVTCKWVTYMCVMSHVNESFKCVTWFIHARVRVMTRTRAMSHVKESFVRVSSPLWMSHLCVWHDSFMHMTSDWFAEYRFFYRALLLFYRALLHMN